MENKETIEKIDLMGLFERALSALGKFWLLILILTLVGGGYQYFNVSRHYTPSYVASATVAVNAVSTSDNYNDITSTSEIVQVFPYILSTGALQDRVAKDLEMSYCPASISVREIENTNWLTISATSGNAQSSYDVLLSTIKNLPAAAEFVIGLTELTVLDESGIPVDTGKEYVIRGSAERGAMMGAAVGIAIMLLYVLTRTTIRDRKELKRVVNLEDMGSLPSVVAKKRNKKKQKDQVITIRDHRAPTGYVESIRKIRIKLVKEMEQRRYKTLLVTSSVPGEGKTTIAANLAIALAKQGRKVLLVDADTRNPSVAHTIADVPALPGLAAYLRSKAELEDCIGEVPNTDGNLLVLCGGEPDPKAAIRLGGGTMKALVEQLKSRADIVIFDAAPADLLTDASALAAYLDAALYVIRYDYARRSQIRGGLSNLSASGIRILGTVFNGDPKKSGAGYGYGYGGYGGYGGYRSYGYTGGGHYGDKRGRKEKDNSGRVVKD